MELADRTASATGNRLVILAGLIVVLLMPTAGRSEDESLDAILKILVTLIPVIPTAERSQGEPIEEIVETLQARVDSLSNKMHLERGRKIYFRACAPCHGIRGDGSGPAAKGFDPAPRNFRRGVYKFRTTVSGALPLDEDLEHTVREGVPGTEMPRWKDVLSEYGIKAVVQYIKTFSPWFDDPYSLPQPEDILEIPEARPFEPSLASVAAGRQLFVEQECDTCHGENGEGDGPRADELVDDWDVPIRPGDLTRPHFANGKRDQDIYRVFTSALNGTPMPAFDDLTDAQRWQLVDYVQSLEQQKGFVYWLFRENPNQVRRPEPEKAEASNTGG